MPRGIPNKKKEIVPNGTVEENKAPETVGRNAQFETRTFVVDAKPVKDSEGFHYNEKTKHRLVDLAPSQAWFRTNDGEMLIGENNKNEIYSDNLKMWVNRVKAGDIIAPGDWIKKD